MLLINDPRLLTFEASLAAIEGFDRDAYKARNELILDHAGLFADPGEITDEAQYHLAYRIKNLVGGLWCSLTMDHPSSSMVADIENQYGKRLKLYNRRALIRDPRHRLVARYLLWNRRFQHLQERTAFLAAREYGLLRKTRHSDDVPWVLVVVGLDRKEGNNIFTVDRHGRHYRQYVESIGRQAFQVLQSHGMNDNELRIFLESIPELEETYRVVAVCDGKHCARASAFTRDAKVETFNLLQSQWAQHLTIQATPALSVSALPMKVDDEPEMVQLDLLAA